MVASSVEQNSEHLLLSLVWSSDWSWANHSCGPELKPNDENLSFQSLDIAFDTEVPSGLPQRKAIQRHEYTRKAIQVLAKSLLRTFYWPQQHGS